mgnify:CR=1 FL=1
MKNSNENGQQLDPTTIKKLSIAEFDAWSIFIGVGVAYIVLTLVLPNNVG